jgi:Tfp pilus assembly protein PilN
MKYSINLLNPEGAKQHVWMPTYLLVQLPLVLILALGGVYFFKTASISSLTAETTTLNKELITKQQQLSIMTQQAQSRQKNRLLESEVNRYSANVSDLRNIQRLLLNEIVGNTQGYSPQLRALARHRVDNLWITEVSIGNRGQHIKIQGITYNAESVPIFLQKLSEEKVFSGIAFKKFSIGPTNPTPSRGQKKSRKKDNELQFTLETQ